MEISFKKALLAPFNDAQWYSKIGIGALLFVPSLIASLYLGPKHWEVTLLTLIARFFVVGYFWLVFHNEINNIENILPEWDFIKITLIAVQAFVFSLKYFLLIAPIFIVFMALIIFLKPLSVVFMIIGGAVLIFLYTIFLPIAQSLFAKDFDSKEAFNFPKIWMIFKNSWKYYLLAFWYSILIGLIYVFSLGVPLGIVKYFNKPLFNILNNILLNISLLLAYISSASLYGQTFKKAIEKI